MANFWAYTNNGISCRGIPEGEPPAEGEIIFDHPPTPEELLAAFPNYTIAASNEALLEQIRVLERANPKTNWTREMRELISLTPEHGMSAQATELNDKIVALRAQIQQVSSS